MYDLSIKKGNITVNQRIKRLVIIFSAMAIGFVVGIYLIGFGSIEHFTSSGPVDMTNAREVHKAMQDPTYYSQIRWGSFSISANWVLPIPLLSTILSGVLADILMKRKSDK